MNKARKCRADSGGVTIPDPSDIARPSIGSRFVSQSDDGATSRWWIAGGYDVLVVRLSHTHVRVNVESRNFLGGDAIAGAGVERGNRAGDADAMAPDRPRAERRHHRILGLHPVAAPAAPRRRPGDRDTARQAAA